MASELRVDRIIPTTGVPSGGGGGIIQTIYSTSTSHHTTTSTSWTSLSWSLSITPKFTSSLILVQFQGLGQQVNTTTALSAITVYKNGSTNLGHATLGLGCVGDVSGSGGVYVTASNSFAVFDAPSTTSSVSYGLYGRLSGSSGTAYPIHGSCRNTFILMEVSA